MKTNVYDLLRTKGAKLQRQEVDPTEFDESGNPKTRSVLMGTGYPRKVLMLNGYSKEELKKAEKQGLIHKTYIGDGGTQEVFYYVPAPASATMDEAHKTQGPSD